MNGPEQIPPEGFPEGFSRASRVFQIIQSRPSRASRVAISVFLLLLALPLLVLALTAGIISMAVYLILAGWGRLFARRTPDWAEHDVEGRKGVKVKR